MEPPPEPPEPPPELELELELEVVSVVVGGESEHDAASAPTIDTTNNTAAGLVLLIHRLAVRGTRRVSELRFFLENKSDLQARSLLYRTASVT